MNNIIIGNNNVIIKNKILKELDYFSCLNPNKTIQYKYYDNHEEISNIINNLSYNFLLKYRDQLNWDCIIFFKKNITENFGEIFIENID